MYILQFFNDKMHFYVLFAIIVHFKIQNLKNKQTFIQTEKAKSSHFDRTRGDKNQIFPTLVSSFKNCHDIQNILQCVLQCASFRTTIQRTQNKCAL